ncbi:hypothetical protein PIB30_072164 [Stylosanthes scabra]|uniref:Putative plant transposon protein domain-containing protein n=1 Tax=Stylosanthes scabra TaxID=79078 RepID=A0ABU6VME4_9FABA|nr:hypothetical protein [Stylosanthes scabra]
MAFSSASYDANGFKSAFHQSLFEDYAAAKAISKLLIQEFYANATRTDDQLRGTHPYKSYVRGVETSDQRLDKVLQELCVPGGRWKLSTSTPVQPIQLKRQDLFPLVRGWHEFIIHSLIPTGNKSEITVARAILIHSIIRGEEVLYKAAGVSMREFKGTELISMGKPITARMMARTRGRNVNLQPNQPVEEEDQPEPMHQDLDKDEQH